MTRFLTELGTGFAYVGKEYRLQIGKTAIPKKQRERCLPLKRLKRN
ncbi:MAG: hypothetical protein ACI3YG_07075 [Prevotella sp.]